MDWLVSYTHNVHEPKEQILVEGYSQRYGKLCGNMSKKYFLLKHGDSLHLSIQSLFITSGFWI